jgi:ubiquinone/menaquinone biosynthesis C-methylase UbiE
MGKAIIDSLQIRDGDLILDIATGTGEPGLTIAGLSTVVDLHEATLLLH